MIGSIVRDLIIRAPAETARPTILSIAAIDAMDIASNLTLTPSAAFSIGDRSIFLAASLTPLTPPPEPSCPRDLSNLFIVTNVSLTFFSKFLLSNVMCTILLSIDLDTGYLLPRFP